MKKVLTAVFIAALFCITMNSYSATTDKQMLYEIKIYHVTPSQAASVDSYLKDAYLPALHRAGIPKAGVFKPVETDTAYGKLIYVFIPFKTIDQYMGLAEILAKDKVYTEAGKSFLDAPYDNPPFTRYESVLLKAFMAMPVFRVPEYSNPASERVYELRDYESATESKAAKKIKMFNEGEVKLFESLGFNAVFYGEVLMGNDKPDLMYMTTFRDMADHDARWQTFRNSPGWKEMSGLEEYKNTVTKAKSYLLHPTDYSDF